MDEKPRFWDFFFGAKYKGHIRIYDKELGALKVYKIPRSLGYMSRIFRFRDPIAGLTPILSIYGILPYNFIFDAYILIWLLQIAVYWLYYIHLDFEEVPKSDWLKEDIDASEKKHKKLNIILNVIIIGIFMTFIFLNSISFTYLRYMAEGESKVEKATVNLSLPDYTDKVLVDSDSPQEVFYSKNNSDIYNDITIEVKTFKIPVQIHVYLNGSEIKAGDIDKGTWFFWQSDYFNNRYDFFIDYGELSVPNTLEVKSDNFDKTWTFTVEQD